MELYSQIKPNVASKIIILANKGLNVYQISKTTGKTKGVINRCLRTSKVTKLKPRLNLPWKGPIKEIRYSFKLWLGQRDLKFMNKSEKIGKECETIYIPFFNFCKHLYDNYRVAGKKVKRSIDEYIKEFKRVFPQETCPSRSWAYKMAKSIHYSFDSKWLPSSKPKVYRLKSDDESRKAIKYNSIEKREDKHILRLSGGNYEIDSVIGKAKDKTAILTLIDISTGDFYAMKYDRTMVGFKNALSKIIAKEDIEIKTLTMDNGGENNLLWEIVDKSKMYNCHAYCSGEKGTLENTHRLVRRVITKGESMDSYSNQDINEVVYFVNNYYSKTFNRV